MKSLGRQKARHDGRVRVIAGNCDKLETRQATHTDSLPQGKANAKLFFTQWQMTDGTCGPKHTTYK